MNTYAKGKRFENKCVKALKAAGYIKDYYIAPRLRFSQNQDIFNLFDIIAHNGGFFIFIQCTATKTGSYERAKKIQAFIKQYPYLEAHYYVMFEEKRKIYVISLDKSKKTTFEVV